MHYAVVMAGGAGTRLWPAARQRHPKQMQQLIFERPLIHETVHRLESVYPRERILVVTAERYADFAILRPGALFDALGFICAGAPDT